MSDPSETPRPIDYERIARAEGYEKNNLGYICKPKHAIDTTWFNSWKDCCIRSGLKI